MNKNKNKNTKYMTNPNISVISISINGLYVPTKRQYRLDFLNTAMCSLYPYLSH